MTPNDCIFCRILDGHVSASLVAETERAVAFMDINQPTPGHVLVIPRVHIEDIYEMDGVTAAGVFQLTVEVARAVQAALQPAGLNLFQSNGRAAGQEVFHFHMHVFARYPGDRDRVHWGWNPNLPPRAELDRLAGSIGAAWQAVRGSAAG
jgi:histidine triad (HIT) family protein